MTTPTDPTSPLADALRTLITSLEVGDLLDGGVTCAAIENEADTLLLVQQQRDQAVARAKKAEAAYEDLRELYGTAVRKKDEWEANAEAAEGRLRVTDAMVARARESLRSDGWTVGDGDTGLRAALTAALAEPPARPEGAEEIEAYMRELVTSHPEDHYGELADHLASRGVLPSITDEMVERGARQTVEEVRNRWESIPERAQNSIRESTRGILRAALTEPPTRPEWADAPAVLAHRGNEGGAPTRVWTNVGEDRWRAGTEGARTVDLTDVTPLHPDRASTADADILADDLAAHADTMLPCTDASRADWLIGRGWRKADQ